MIPKLLTWNDRFALIDKFKPNDDTILMIFGVTDNELNAARSLRMVGVLVPAKNLDYNTYAPSFSTNQIEVKNQMTTQEPTEPQTATRKVLKRGRKGNNIATAFQSVPNAPTNAADFALEHKVSMAVLRQSKRFDPFPDTGQIRVKKDKESGQLTIWRESVVDTNNDN